MPATPAAPAAAAPIAPTDPKAPAPPAAAPKVAEGAPPAKKGVSDDPDGLVRVVVTKFGAGKVSTGQHAAAKGDVMAQRGDVMSVPPLVAKALEARGFAELDTPQ